MTSQIYGALLVAALSFSVNAPAQDQAPSADQAAIVKLEHDWMDAENRHDASALNAILDDRLVVTFESAKSIDKATYLKGLTAGPADPSARQDIVNEQLLIDGNTAVAVLLNTMQGTRAGKHYDVVYRITVTFIKHGDRWKALALQGGAAKS